MMTSPGKYVVASIFFLLIGSGIAAMAQVRQSSITGKIVDAKTKEALSFIAVKLFRNGDSLLVATSLSNPDGIFLFSEIEVGAYYTEVDVLGYRKSIHPNLTLSERSQSLNLGILELQLGPQQLHTVNIKLKKQLIERRDDKTIINVSASILSAGSTAMEILARIPGVTLDNEGNVSLKGKPGVRIMIDGKLTYLSAAQLANLLRATTGNSIQTIEVIASPSAKYDATGTGGIINIKLKKDSSSGTNGTLTTGGGWGSYPKADIGLALNNRNRKVNIFGNFNYANNKQFENILLTRSANHATDITFFDQNAREVSLRRNNNYKAGVDYFINANKTIGLTINGYANGYSGSSGVFTNIGNQPGAIDSTVLAQNSFNGKYRNQTFNLNYTSVMDTLGQELSADLDVSSVRNIATANYNNTFLGASGLSYRNPILFRNFTPSKIDIFAAKLDYTLALPRKAKVETGIKSSLVNTDNNFRSEQKSDQQWKDNESQSNRFVYRENVNAAYINFRKEFNSTSLLLGLRTELTHTEGKSVTLKDQVVRNYIDFFPSLSINQTLSKENTLSFTYSRRIDRPDYQSLNPFIYYSDLFTRSQGNPALRPQYANSFDLNYGYKNLHISLGYIRTRDVITTTLLTDVAKKAILFYEQNLASRRTFSLNLNNLFDLTDWWSSNNDATLYNSRFTNPELMGVPFENKKTTLELSSIHTFKLSTTLNTEVAATYTSSQVYGTYLARPICGVDLGVGKSFADGRASIKLAINDLFDQRQIKIKSAMPSQDYQLSQKQESRVFRATFSYNFGSHLLKPVRNRSSGSTAEQDRIKSGR
jgi:hypothetical protein